MTNQNAQGVLVSYGIDECQPFRAMQDSLKIVEQAFGGRLRVQYVDVWEEPESVLRLGFLSVPATVLYVNGELRLRLQGFHRPAQLTEKIVAALEDVDEFHLPQGLERPGLIKRLMQPLLPQLR